MVQNMKFHFLQRPLALEEKDTMHKSLDLSIMMRYMAGKFKYGKRGKKVKKLDVSIVIIKIIGVMIARIVSKH
jgi:hypothetical protein